MFVTPAPSKLMAAESSLPTTVMVYGLAPAVNTIPLISMELDESEILVTEEVEKVATSAGAVGMVFGNQFSDVQLPLPGVESHVALPAWTGELPHRSSAATEPASGAINLAVCFLSVFMVEMRGDGERQACRFGLTEIMRPAFQIHGQAPNQRGLVFRPGERQ